MAIVWRWIILLFMVCSCEAAVVATTPENRAFNAAAEAFRAGFFERADRELGDFVSKFPASPRLPEAVLLRAQARVQTTNYSGAIELLTAGQKTAGGFADQFSFWIAEATLRQGETAKAADLFAGVATNFPASSRLLEAVISEATARATLGQWEQISTSLGQTNSPFQAALKTSLTNALVARGALLLSQAHLARGEFPHAEESLRLVSEVVLDPVLQWQRQHLLCRIRIAQGRFEEGLAISTNLVKGATNAFEPLQAPEATAMHAGLLVKTGRPDEAIAAYEKNLVPGLPEAYQREALLKVTELSINRGRLGYAAQLMEKFAAQQPASPVLDAVLFTTGELKMRQYAALLNDAPAKAAQAANLLEESVAALSKLIASFPNSALLGKAHLNLGWCFWFQGKLAESQAAFAKAAELLPKSIDQAVAIFKLGDAQLGLKEYTNSIASYSALVSGFAEDPRARTNFIERALYQTVRAAIFANDRYAATNALRKMIQWFPGGLLAERSVLLGGIEVSKFDPLEARAIYRRFIETFPDAELLPEVQLALARSYEQQGDWTNAIAEYDLWIERHTNHSATARAEYSRAWANAQAGRSTNAFRLFTNFTARFPATEFTPMAQWWVGDYYLGLGQVENAERAYKSIFQSTNWPASEITYQARMMAGRAAFARDKMQAAEYFTSLWNDTNCPPDIRAQALFAYGDTLMTIEPSETNKVANYDEAIRVFSRIAEMFPTNQTGVLALGQKASCLMQWAHESQQYDAASDAFRQVIASPAADGRVRSIAKVGLASVLEKQAEKIPARKTELLNEAMNHCLDVFFGANSVLTDGEVADPFWVRRAGLDAARIAENLGAWAQAIEVYQRLQELIPVLRPRMEKNVARAQEQLLKGLPPQPPLAEKK